MPCQNLTGCGKGALVRFGAGSYETNTVYPAEQVRYQRKGVPDLIARDFEEALGCATHGFRFAAAVVARRVVQATVIHVGGKGDDLYKQIDSLPAETLAPTLRDAAHQVRLIGNDAAHAGQVSEEDIDQLLAFTHQLLNFLFVLPAELQLAEIKRPSP